MNVLLLGDITGKSRVALRMLSRVLEEYGHEVMMLPTALISNTLNLGRHEMLDTTAYLLHSLKVWEELGIDYDIAYIGYITGMEQAKALCAVADRLREKGVPVIVDPILGDNGKRYNSISQEQEEGMKLLCAHASLITPNLTEAALLTGRRIEEVELEQALADLAHLGSHACDVIITSAKTAQGKDVIAIRDTLGEENALIPFDRVPGHRWGTGDLFTGVLMNGLLDGEHLSRAAMLASDAVHRELLKEKNSLLPV